MNRPWYLRTDKDNVAWMLLPSKQLQVATYGDWQVSWLEGASVLHIRNVEIHITNSKLGVDIRITDDYGWRYEMFNAWTGSKFQLRFGNQTIYDDFCKAALEDYDKVNKVYRSRLARQRRATLKAEAEQHGVSLKDYQAKLAAERAAKSSILKVKKDSRRVERIISISTKLQKLQNLVTKVEMSIKENPNGCKLPLSDVGFHKAMDNAITKLRKLIK